MSSVIYVSNFRSRGHVLGQSEQFWRQGGVNELLRAFWKTWSEREKFEKWTWHDKKREPRWWLWSNKAFRTMKSLLPLAWPSGASKRSIAQSSTPTHSKIDLEVGAQRSWLTETNERLPKWSKRKKPPMPVPFLEPSRPPTPLPLAQTLWGGTSNHWATLVESRKRSPNSQRNTKKLVWHSPRSMKVGPQMIGWRSFGPTSQSSICSLLMGRSTIGQTGQKSSLKMGSRQLWSLVVVE